MCNVCNLFRKCNIAYRFLDNKVFTATPVCWAISLNEMSSNSFCTKTNFCSSGNSSNALFKVSQNIFRKYSVSGLLSALKNNSVQEKLASSSLAKTSSNNSGLCLRILSVILFLATVKSHPVSCSMGCVLPTN